MNSERSSNRAVGPKALNAATRTVASLLLANSNNLGAAAAILRWAATLMAICRVWTSSLWSRSTIAELISPLSSRARVAAGCFGKLLVRLRGRGEQHGHDRRVAQLGQRPNRASIRTSGSPVLADSTTVAAGAWSDMPIQEVHSSEKRPSSVVSPKPIASSPAISSIAGPSTHPRLSCTARTMSISRERSLPCAVQIAATPPLRVVFMSTPR